MIYLCADLHGDLGVVYELEERGLGLGKEDFLIVLGDFGVCRGNIDQIRRLDSRVSFTVLFIEGNHDDIPLIHSFPEKVWHGGAVHDISGVLHLCRGEIFSLPSEGAMVSVAALGGADSRDREERTEGVDWFSEEAITDSDVGRLISRASEQGMRVDYFLSHAPSSAIKEEWDYEYKKNHKGKSPFEPTPSDYKVRDAVSSIEASVYYSAHEHIEREGMLSGKRYVSVYKQPIKALLPR